MKLLSIYQYYEKGHFENQNLIQIGLEARLEQQKSWLGSTRENFLNKKFRLASARAKNF